MSNLFGSYIDESENIEIVNGINSICENTICGIYPLDEEYIEEYILVNEIYFSKKDLQDPETFKKLLKRAQTEKDIKKKLDILFYCLTFIEAIFSTKMISKAGTKAGIGGLSFGNALVAFITLMVIFVKLTSKIVSGLDKALLYIHKDRINKLIKKTKELRDKTDNPQVKANCQKLLDSIEKYYKDLEDEKFKKLVNKVENVYEELVSIIQGQSAIEDPYDFHDIFYLCDNLKIRYDLVEKGQIKYGSKHMESAEEVFDMAVGSNKKEAEQLKKYMPEFENNGKGSYIQLYYAIDDTIFMYSPKGRVFCYSDYFFEDSDFDAHIYDLIKPIDSDFEKEKNFIEALKVADAELGYYRLTPAPEGVTQKKI